VTVSVHDALIHIAGKTEIVSVDDESDQNSTSRMVRYFFGLLCTS